jgi:ABC-2 type transport system ATP-binding protein
MRTQVIRIEGLSKVYSSRRTKVVQALDRVDLSLSQGEIFGLLGRNGAGKTTLLRILTTLIRPTSGHASILGHDVVAEPEAVRRSICVVLQENAAELYLTVLDNLRTYARFQRIRRSEVPQRIDRVLELFGLQEHRGQKVIDLSGGMRRRVQVAKAFMVDTAIIFLDEATTGMDPFNRRATLDAIREEARRGRTIFLTTHLLEEAEELCDRIALIDHGRIVASGDLQTIKSLAAHVVNLAVSFDAVSPALLDRLRSIPARTFVQRGNTFELCVEGSSAQALEVMTALAREFTVTHFDIGSATLEDAFLQLLGTAP